MSTLYRLGCAGNPQLLHTSLSRSWTGCLFGVHVLHSAAPCRGKDGGGRVLCSHFLQELRVHVSPLLSLCALDRGCTNLDLSVGLLSLMQALNSEMHVGCLKLWMWLGSDHYGHAVYSCKWLPGGLQGRDLPC